MEETLKEKKGDRVRSLSYGLYGDGLYGGGARPWPAEEGENVLIGDRKDDGPPG